MEVVSPLVLQVFMKLNQEFVYQIYISAHLLRRKVIIACALIIVHNINKMVYVSILVQIILKINPALSNAYHKYMTQLRSSVSIHFKTAHISIILIIWVSIVQKIVHNKDLDTL